ncbi:MAG: acyl--CoA ligase [Acidimicrobiia bacterium]|nr:acyl--CoA ligase [Acidimicrobiia bacterium]
MNIMMLLEMASSGFGDRVAIGTGDDALTYQELFDNAGRAATRFAESGVDHVGLIDISSPALPVVLFGAGWAGVPYVPMNYRLDTGTLLGLAERISPATAVCHPDQVALADGIDGISAETRTDFVAGLADAEPYHEAWGMDGEDIAVLLFTSGTTGEPKAAVLRHKHLVSYILGSVEFMGAGEDEAILVSVPPYHVAGLASLLSSIFAGRRIVQLPQFDADAWIDLAIAEQVTNAMVVPTMLSRVVDRLDERRLSIPSLRALSYGGGKMPLPIIERALELLPGTNFVNAYGLTETSSTLALLGPDDHRTALASDDPEVRARLGSVGRPLPSVEISIRDDRGNEVPAGGHGEVWARGEQISGEYVGKGSRLTADGWFPTNDGGWIDAEGYVFVTGRMDDVIIRGGENISPGEIEDVITSHPAVMDAAAIGVADQQWGEVIAVVAVPDHGATVEADVLIDLVRSQLRGSKVPEHVVFRDELPYNETGKLLRRVLRDEYAHLGDGSS